MNCKCRKRLADRLVEKCDEDINGNEIIHNVAFYDFWLAKNVCRSCTLYIILLIMACILMIMSISGTYFYFYRYIKGSISISQARWVYIFNTLLHDIYASNGLFNCNKIMPYINYKFAFRIRLAIILNMWLVLIN